MRRTPNGTARVEFEVRFPAATKGRRRAQPRQETAVPPLKPVPPRVPRITQLLVLGYHFERLVRDGKVKNYAEIARLTGLSRARVTQIVNLVFLSFPIQEAVLLNSSADPELTERAIRSQLDRRFHD